MRSFLTKTVASSDRFDVLDATQRLYEAWTAVDVPAEYHNLVGISKRARPPSEQRQDERSQHECPQKRQGLIRSMTRSQGQDSQVAADRYAGGQQRADLPFRRPEEDGFSSITDDTVVEDDNDWIEYIHKWQKESDGAAGGREYSRDEQLTAYIDEPARTHPSSSVWDCWKPAWDSRSLYPNFSDRSRFSSR
ncbi:hypothetical protein EV363DRAFT_1300414 [Boletus edulis]|nr:hypothetical protein EV363DRAFT_1300414 [Boletus edulis]